MVDLDFERIARAYGIRLLLQFGSTVSGATHPRSDVDLAVFVERDPLSLEQHSGLLHELQRVFPEREVDLAVLNHADPLFLKKVTEQCRLLYGAPAELRRPSALRLQALPGPSEVPRPRTPLRRQSHRGLVR